LNISVLLNDFLNLEQREQIEYNECLNVINKLKFNENSNLFALESNKGLKSIIDNNTLTAVTLLITESNPKEKSIIIDLVINFLHN